MTYPTDAAVEAGAKAIDETPVYGSPVNFKERMSMSRACLLAARAADPPPTMAEFQRAADAYAMARVESYRLTFRSVTTRSESDRALAEQSHDKIVATRDDIRALFARAIGEVEE
jgi:hypothetical protein